MPRQKNDGRGRLGGRVAGTPNKEKPLKAILRSHSIDYFTPKWREDFKKELSDYEMDLMLAKPNERLSAELALLKYHTPQMQATSVDVAVVDEKKTLSQRLAELAREDE